MNIYNYGSWTRIFSENSVTLHVDLGKESFPFERLTAGKLYYLEYINNSKSISCNLWPDALLKLVNDFRTYNSGSNFIIFTL